MINSDLGVIVKPIREQKKRIGKEQKRERTQILCSSLSYNFYGCHFFFYIPTTFRDKIMLVETTGLVFILVESTEARKG